MAHAWTAPGLFYGAIFVVSESPYLHTPDVVTPQYTIRFVFSDGINILSSLTVISDAEFNNTRVRCYNPHGESLQITAVVLGMIFSN